MNFEVLPLSSLEEALALAEVRNECRTMMTHDQTELAPDQQKTWFETQYLKQDPIRYRVWLLKEKGLVIGYCAVKEESDGFYITEGIKKSHRGKGGASFLLKTLLARSVFQNKSLFADIFNHNLASISFHQKFHFKYHSQLNGGITRFYL